MTLYKEMKNWREQFFNKKWLQISKEIMYRKLIGNTRALEDG
jgi:hypothetical protein